MTSAQDGPGVGEPVERFRPTSGRFVGSLSLAVVAGILVYAAVAERTVVGLRLATGAAFFGVLVWLTQLRPRVTAYRDVLRLQNSVRDVDVPLARVGDVHVGRMLSVWVGQKRYVCVGISAPLRRMVMGRKQRPSSLFGWDRLEEYAEHATPPRPEPSAVSYPEYVEGRIVALADEARRRAEVAEPTAEEPTRGAWAWPGIGALAATGAAFVVSLLL
jgi:hypothetical protein